MRRAAQKVLSLGAMKKIVLGEKAASSLAPQVVYNVAHRLADTDIDAGALEGVSKNFPNDYKLLPKPEALNISPGTQMLSDAESRAALVVLLYRLLEGGSEVRKDIPIFIREVLNSDAKLQFQGTEQPLIDIAHVAYLKDLGIAETELGALQASARDSTSLGIAAISAHLASYLIEISDFVAGLSCEALQAKTAMFEEKFYKQDSSHNSVADAAKTMRSLLQNSLLINPRKGFLDAEYITSIPEVHGAFKEACKCIFNLLRVELNRISSVDAKLSSWPTSSGSSPQLGYLLVDAYERFTVSLGRLVLYSSERILEGLKMINGLSGEAKPAWVDDILSKGQAPNEWGMPKSKLMVFRKSLKLVEEATDVLALEAAVALMLISLREKESAVRGPKRLVLGNGTACSRDILLTILAENRDGENDVLRRWFEELKCFFSPKDDGLQKFIETVKSLIETSGGRPQVPKGTRDFGPEQMIIREKCFADISRVFKRHGASSLDTPVFELRETLMGKYGEDSKLIYNLEDQGGQMLSLRYDLTVPFARYLATYNKTNMKRYHIAKVYRRDNPSHGRFREFYQCDFDIAGDFPSMVPDAEVIKVLTELLDELKIGTYEVKLNHRKLLDGMLEICGVPHSKFRAICSSIDKLDKTPWDKVRNEMVVEKGLLPEVADRIESHVGRRGNAMSVLKELRELPDYAGHAGSTTALKELSTLFDYLEASGCLDRVVFDLSLARGLDYYTGVIYEAVFTGDNQVGSIAAGGRYDNLVGSMFQEPDNLKSKKPNKTPKQVPAVGVSLGIERVLLLKEKEKKEAVDQMSESEVKVLYLGVGVENMKKAFKLASELWAADVKTEFECVSASKLQNKITNVLSSGIKLMVIVGDAEESFGGVRLKDIVDKGAEKSDGDLIPRNDIVREIVSRLHK